MANTQKNMHHSPNIIINDLSIRSIDRCKKDISTWHSALQQAEQTTNPNRCRLYDVYEDVLLDGHLTGLLAKRMDAVLNKELCFVRQGMRDPSFYSLIQSLPFRSIIRGIMETLFWGISGLEFVPGKQLQVLSLPRKHIKPHLGIIAYDQHGDEGIAYAHYPNIWVLGNPIDLGLLAKCAPYSLYKRGGLADWAEFVELFGQPVRILKYDAYDEQTREELKRILEASGSALALILPKQVDYEIKDGKSSNGDGQLQLSFIKALNDELSILILGNTDTTTVSASSGYAQSKIHLEQQFEITKSDVAMVQAMLNTKAFAHILASYGYDTQGGQFQYSKEKDIDYLRKRIEIDSMIHQFQPFPASYWASVYGV